MKQKYWYKTWKEVCEMCGRIITEERKRVYKEEEATRETEYTPCEDCYRWIVL